MHQLELFAVNTRQVESGAESTVQQDRMNARLGTEPQQPWQDCISVGNQAG